jgi:hypothetical protein
VAKIYLQRDATGRVSGLTADPDVPGAEPASVQDADVRNFLEGLDLELVRVLEDLIDLLVDRGVFRFTDLPEPAQEKLLYRKSVRRHWRVVDDPLSGDESLF